MDEFEMQELTLLNIKQVLHKEFSMCDSDKLGVNLGIPLSDIKTFKHDSGSDSERLFNEIIDHWLRNHQEQSWSKLAKALELSNYTVLAKSIKERIASPSNQSSVKIEDPQKGALVQYTKAEVPVETSSTNDYKKDMVQGTLIRHEDKLTTEKLTYYGSMPIKERPPLLPLVNELPPKPPPILSPPEKTRCGQFNNKEKSITTNILDSKSRKVSKEVETDQRTHEQPPTTKVREVSKRLEAPEYTTKLEMQETITPPPASPPGSAIHDKYQVVLNQSTRKLSKKQIEILSYGLKYNASSPTALPDLTESFDRFLEHCCRSYFVASTRSYNSHMPGTSRTCQQRMRNRPQDLSPLPNHTNNMTPSHRIALEQLREKRNLTIITANEGTCIVLMDTSTYQQEVLQQLADTSVYLPLEEDPSMEIASRCNQTVQTLNTLNFLTSKTTVETSTALKEVRTQKLYCVKNIHKDSHTLRPMVLGGPTEKLSSLLDHLLSPSVQKIKSMVTNSVDVVRKIENLKLDSTEEIHLVSFHVESLYMSIPQSDCCQIITNRVYRDLEKLGEKLLLDLLELAVQENVFEFAGKIFKQVKGVAMGTSCARTIADLFLAELEERALESWSGPQPLIWLRHIDNIFAVWKGNKEQLQLFHNHLNKRTTHIRFTMKSNNDSITFLDLELYKDRRFRTQGIMDVRPYHKPTNPRAFLHHSSCQQNIVRKEYIRLMVASSSLETFSSEVSLVNKIFREQEYPQSLLQEQMSRIYVERRYFLLKEEKRRPSDGTATLTAPTNPNKVALDKVMMDNLPMDTKAKQTTFTNLSRDKPPRMELRLGTKLLSTPKLPLIQEQL